MINSNIQTEFVNGFSKDAQIKLIAPKLWFIEHAFDQEILTWMKEITTNTDNQFEVTRPHHRLNLLPSNDYNRLQKIGLDLIPALNQLTGEDLNLMITKYWLDLPGFGCQVHHDAEDILVTFQCYVASSGDTVGAEFLHVEPGVKIPLKTNCGYINLNTDLKLHQVISAAGTRQSIAFQYNQNPLS